MPRLLGLCMHQTANEFLDGAQCTRGRLGLGDPEAFDGDLDGVLKRMTPLTPGHRGHHTALCGVVIMETARTLHAPHSGGRHQQLE